MRKIILIRHGKTEANDRHLYCGRTDLPLSENGKECLKQLKESGTYPNIQGMNIFTSGLLRTEETLSILYGQVVHTQVPGLREVDFGDFEMRGYEELKEDPAFIAWCTGDNESNIPPNGESSRQMAERVWNTFRSMMTEENDFAAILHGGPISVIMAELFPEEGRIRYQWQPENGTGYLLTDNNGQLKYQTIPAGGHYGG